MDGNGNWNSQKAGGAQNTNPYPINQIDSKNRFDTLW